MSQKTVLYCIVSNWAPLPIQAFFKLFFSAWVLTFFKGRGGGDSNSNFMRNVSFLLERERSNFKPCLPCVGFQHAIYDIWMKFNKLHNIHNISKVLIHYVRDRYSRQGLTCFNCRIMDCPPGPRLYLLNCLYPSSIFKFQPSSCNFLYLLLVP